MKHRSNHETENFRVLRLQTVLLEELQSLLRDEIRDRRLLQVHFRALSLSPDGRHGRVHFVIRRDTESESKALEITSDEVHNVQSALEQAKGFFRRQLADAVEMKFTPDLRFVFDGVEEFNDSAHTEEDLDA